MSCRAAWLAWSLWTLKVALMVLTIVYRALCVDPHTGTCPAADRDGAVGVIGRQTYLPGVTISKTSASRS
jgi:hypothetical protein